MHGSGYLGSKGSCAAYPLIVGSMPPHTTYIEAFAGSGAVLRAKPACSRSIAVDLDPTVFEKFPYPAGVETVRGVDAIAFLAAFDYGDRPAETLVYCDPPYLLSTRTSNKRYTCEMTEADHNRLIDLLRSLSCSIIISGYASALYDERLKGWSRRQFQVMTRGGVRTEVIWMNYQQDARLLSKYVGENFTDRQRIKRKAERWKANFQAMPEGERNVVLAALLDTASDSPAA